MLKRLIQNTLITGLSFFFTGLVPLLLVPLFLKQYGLEQYGVLVLVRLLLPTGALAVFDPGLSEAASYAVAKARHDKDWSRCGRYLGGLLKINLLLGALAACALGLAEPLLAGLFGISVPLRPGFSHIVYATAVSFPLLLASLVAEGVLKGFEDFKRLRSIDILSVTVYAAAAVGAVWSSLPFEWIALIYILYFVFRTLLIALLARRYLHPRGATMARPRPSEWLELKARCAPLWLNRSIGVPQGYAAPLLIGALAGAAAAGLFDLLTRIPRFLKVVSGILNSAVLPVVLRMDEAGDRAGLQRLMRLGLLGVLSVVTPIVAWGMCFSEPLLRLWVSETYSALWPWQSLMFAWPLINAVTSFSCGALLGRSKFVSALNWIVLGQIGIQLSVSVATFPFFSAKAFIAGQILALSISLPFQLRLVFKDCDLHVREFKRHLGVLAIFAVATAAAFVFEAGHAVHTILQLIVSLAAWCATSAFLVWIFVFSPSERSNLASMITRRYYRNFQ
jgi:O-antigen/teichoic acid export membrane protein